MNISQNKETFFYIRKARKEDWENAMELAFRTFLKYEADEYGPEGIQNFSAFVTDQALKKMFLQGSYLLYVAVKEERIIGLISMRSGNHISLLFVDEQYHRKGVGTALVRCLQSYMLHHTAYEKITVNAAPYGVPFYRRIGFIATGTKTRREGIIYTPMEFYI